MKKILIFILLGIIPLGIFSQDLRDNLHIKTEIFEVIYSEVLQQPKWVTYTVQCPNGKAPRTGMDFYTNDSIKTSDNADYVDNVYDKGHCAPAADFNCTKEMLYKTFSYVNCVLQNQYLNRGVWRLLEAYERDLAATTGVTVKIKMVYSNSSIKLPTGATVPDGFYKIITYNNRVEKYYFPNTKPTSSDFKQYLIK